MYVDIWDPPPRAVREHSHAPITMTSWPRDVDRSQIDLQLQDGGPVRYVKELCFHRFIFGQKSIKKAINAFSCSLCVRVVMERVMFLVETRCSIAWSEQPDDVLCEMGRAGLYKSTFNCYAKRADVVLNRFDSRNRVQIGFNRKAVMSIISCCRFEYLPTFNLVRTAVRVFNSYRITLNS